MKVTRRGDKGNGGHLLISVPAEHVAVVEAALRFLEATRHQRGSHVVIALILRAAKRCAWRLPALEDHAPPPEGPSEGGGDQVAARRPSPYG